jgi:Flp pilus assembly protein TadD
VLRLKPESAQVHNNLGYALYEKHDLEGAIAEYHKALALDPKLVAAYYNLGISLFEKGEAAAALEELRAAYLLAPDNPTIRDTYEKFVREAKR